MIDTPDIDKFLAAAVRAIRAGEPARWKTDADAAWSDVWTRIEYHGIPLLLHRRVELLDAWPQPLLERMAEEARLMVLWETTHHDAICTLLRELNASNIASVIMKGTALAYGFHDAPPIRRRGDTDLLIRPRDKEQTRATLKKLGWYRKPDPHGLNYQEGWLHNAAGFFVHALDLHWEPSERAVLHSVLPLDLFFSTKQPLPEFCKDTFRPDNATMVLHGAINQKWHAMHGYDAEKARLASPSRLIWMVDFDLLVRSMTDDDWAILTRHCTRERTGPLVAEALRGAQRDLGAVLPESHLAELEAYPIAPDILTYFTKLDGLSQFWLDLRKTRGVRAKAHLIRSRALPPRQHLMEKYPSAQNWPTAILQARLMIETAGRIMRRAVLR